MLCIVQKNILIKQTVKHFSHYVDDIAIYNAGMKQKKFGTVTIASIQSLARCEDIPNFDILILDEIHRFAVNDRKSQVRRVLSKMNETIVLAFTATPFVNTTPIFGENKFFDEITYEKTAKELTEEKYLSPLVYVGEQNDTKIDLSKVAKNKGDFVVSSLSRVIMQNEDKIQAQIQDALDKSVGRKKILILCTSIDHANYVHSIIGGSLVHSKSKNRDSELDRFKTTERYLTSVLVASEGFDNPAADCLWMFRPTRSLTLYIQAVGRIMRLFKGKENALFLDYGGIVDACGDIYEAYEKGITGKGKSKSLKICPLCGRYNEAGTVECSCGYHFTKPCQHCLEEVRLGERQCPSCGGDLTKKVDPLANTTEKSYSDIITAFVDKVVLKPHHSKNGNACHRIEFYSGFMPFLIQYVVAKPWAEKKFTKNQHRNFVDYMKNIKTVTYSKVGKYNQILKMEL